MRQFYERTTSMQVQYCWQNLLAPLIKYTWFCAFNLCRYLTPRFKPLPSWHLNLVIPYVSITRVRQIGNLQLCFLVYLKLFNKEYKLLTITHKIQLTQQQYVINFRNGKGTLHVLFNTLYLDEILYFFVNYIPFIIKRLQRGWFSRE